jgi:hypothetical protein
MSVTKYGYDSRMLGALGTAARAGVTTKTSAIGRWPQFHLVAIRRVTEREVEREATGAARKKLAAKGPTS